MPTLAQAPATISHQKELSIAKVETDQIENTDYGELVFIITGTPNLNEEVTITWKGISLTFTVNNNRSGTGLDIPDSGGVGVAGYADFFRDWLLENDILAEAFVITREQSGTDEIVKCTYRNLEEVDIEVTENLTNITVVANDSSGPLLQDNLSCVMKVVTVDDAGVETTELSLNTPYDPVSKQAAFNLSSALLTSPYVPDPANIELSTYAIEIADSVLQEYWIRYADRGGTPAVTKRLIKSGPYYMLHAGHAGSTIGTLPTAFAKWVAHNYITTDANAAAIIKPVLPDQPDWVYFMTDEVLPDVTPGVIIELSDGTTQTYSPYAQTFDLEKDVIYALPAGFRQLNLHNATIPDGTDIVGYTFRMVRDANVYMSVQFAVDCNCYPWTMYLLCDNGVGGMESIGVRGKKTHQYEVSREVFHRTRWEDWTPTAGDLGHFAQEGQQRWEVSTGWYEASYIKHLRQLLMSDAVYWIDTANERFVKVVIDTETMEDERDDEQLFQLTFQFGLASFDHAYNSY